MSHELLNHADVLKTIRAELLRGGYQKEEIDDGVREVVAEVFEYLATTDEKIETVDRMQAVVRTPSYRRGVDALRAKYTRTQYFGGSTDKADAHPAPASSDEERLDMRRALKTIEENQEKHDGAIIEALEGGVSQKQLAAKLSLSHDQARKETVSMRSRHRRTLVAAGYGGLIAGVLVLFLVVFRTRLIDEQAKPEPVPTPTTAPPAPPPQVPVAMGPAPEDAQKAAMLRARAHTAAQNKDWARCSQDYADALELDQAAMSHDALVESYECGYQLEQRLEAKPR